MTTWDVPVSLFSFWEEETWGWERFSNLPMSLGCKWQGWDLNLDLSSLLLLFLKIELTYKLC